MQCKREVYPWIFIFYLFVLTLFAYYFKPNELDLTRLHAVCLKTWCNYPWDFLTRFLEKSSVPAWYLFSWSIYQVTHDVNFIQAVACFWCFGNVFYVINDIIQRNRLHRTYSAILLFVVMAIGSFYLQTISDIRNMLSFSICFWCMYRELVQGKMLILHIPLYLFAALLHPAGLVIVVSRLLFWALNQKSIFIKIVLAGFLVPGLIYIFRQQNIFVTSAIDLAHAYASNANEYRMWQETIIGTIELGQIFYILYCYRKYTGNKLYQLWRFAFIFSLISFCAIPISYAIFRRYTILCSLLTLPMIGSLLSASKPIVRKNLAFWLLLQSILIFCLSYSLGDMRFYQFLMF